VGQLTRIASVRLQHIRRYIRPGVCNTSRTSWKNAYRN